MKNASGNSRNGQAVARDAHLGIAPPQPVGVEAGTVRVKPESSSHRRVAGHAISFHVTGNAGLERLAGCLSMSHDERRAAVVKTGAAQRTLCAQSSLHVAAETELLSVVTVGAGGLASIGRRRVPDQEAGRMVITALGRL